MRIGVSVGNLAPVGFDAGACVAFAQAADGLGYDSVWVHDHVAVPRRRETPYPYAQGDSPATSQGPRADAQAFEPLVMMSALAAATDTVRIGVCVLAIPYRHPAVTAKMLATADLLSGGRVVLGAGTGWMREEFEALGLSAEQFRRRGDMTDEYLRAIKEMWTNTGPSFYRGRFLQFEDVGTFPKPLQVPHPPIVVAGGGEAAMVRTSRLGNGYQTIGVNPPELARQVDQLRAICLRDRRDPDEIEVHLMSTVRFTSQPLDGQDRRPLHGTAEQIAEDLVSYASAGLEHLVAVPSVDDEPDWARSRTAGAEKLAREVAPAFRRTQGQGAAAATVGTR